MTRTPSVCRLIDTRLDVGQPTGVSTSPSGSKSEPSAVSAGFTQRACVNGFALFVCGNPPACSSKPQQQ